MREGWKEVRLGEVINTNNTNLGKNYHHTKIKYIDISSVGTGEILFNEEIEFSTAPSRAKRLVENGDTIISSVRPGNRNFAFIKNVADNVVVSTGFTTLHAKSEKINPRFLYYLISDNRFTDYLVSVEKGANYPAISPKDIEDAVVNFPPLETQRKIASILSGYDDLIENNLKRIKILEEMAQQTYEEWFVRMRFPGYETAVMNEETGLPEGWEKVKLGEWIKTSSGGTPSKKKEVEFYENGTIPWVRTGELKNFILIDSEIKITASGLKNSSAKLFPKGTVLLAMYGNTIGEVTYCDFSTSTNQACCGFLVKNENESYFIHQYLLKNKEQVLSFRMGAAQENISQTIIQNMELIKPNEILLTEFGQITKRFYDSIINLLNQNQRLREARDLLLPRLMMGIVEV